MHAFRNIFAVTIGAVAFFTPTPIVAETVPSASDQMRDRTMLDVLKEPRFSAFMEAVELSGLDFNATLSGERGFVTLFVPTNEAFAEAQTPNMDIANVLLYHFSSGNATLQDGGSAKTFQGSCVQFTQAMNGAFMVDDANVLESIFASDGTIYVIDSVLEPPTAQPVLPENQPTFCPATEPPTKSGTEIFSEFGPNFCMVTSGVGEGSHVKLGDYQDCTFFSIANDGLFHFPKGRADLCLQAGYGNTLEDGSKMRVFPCDSTNEFQQFSWNEFGTANPIKLRSTKYKSLCATNRGTHADKGDPIIFKVCDTLHPKSRMNWFSD